MPGITAQVELIVMPVPLIRALPDERVDPILVLVQDQHILQVTTQERFAEGSPGGGDHIRLCQALRFTAEGIEPEAGDSFGSPCRAVGCLAEIRVAEDVISRLQDARAHRPGAGMRLSRRIYRW